MTSNDQAVFNNLSLVLEKHFAETKEQLALMRKENAEFREQIKDDIHKEFDKVHSEIAQLHTEIGYLNTKIEVQTARIDDLFHWNYWIIALFVAFFMMPSVIDGVKAFFRALTDGVTNLFSTKKG